MLFKREYSRQPANREGRRRVGTETDGRTQAPQAAHRFKLLGTSQSRVLGQ